MQTLYEILTSKAEYQNLLKTINSTEVAELLKGEELYTLFVPRRPALIQFLVDMNLTLDGLIEKQDFLTKMLKYHMLPGKITLDDVKNMAEAARVNTVCGEKLHFHKNEKGFYFEDMEGNWSPITNESFEASNGYLHIIDRVLMPE